MRDTCLALFLAASFLTSACGGSEVTRSAPDELDRAAPAPSGGGRKSDTDKPVKDPAPDFTVTTFTGEEFSLAAQKGTPVVLNFWESW